MVLRRIVFSILGFVVIAVLFQIVMFFIPRNVAELERLQKEAASLRLGSTTEETKKELRRLGFELGSMIQVKEKGVLAQGPGGSVTAEKGDIYLFAQKEYVAYTPACGHHVYVFAFFEDGKLTRI